ncbi:MAG: glycine cleavage system protein H [Planctomycetota bacterium]|nr:MAG: glycine cleavage system protein H [Planctomycetota bacterium]
MAETRYSTSHEWCRLEDGIATCGLTQHAVDELGDLTFLDYRVEPGASVSKGDVIGEIDSVKATSEIYAPVGGTVEAVNERFQNEDELAALSAAPESDGWLVKIKASDPAEFSALLDAEAYRQHCAQG